MSFIEASQLTKVFRHDIKEPGLIGAAKHLFTQKHVNKTAVDHIDLRIEEGEAVAYVGPNGAGKSTTIKMMSGILVPTSGSVKVAGILPYKNRIENAKIIGAVFGQRTQLWWDIPIQESFSLLKDIYAIPDSVYRKNMQDFTEMLQLDEILHLSARKLSLGQRMRADLAAALLHNPKMVYLDEPTIGLDVSVKQRIREFIKTINRELGTTILLTTHDLGDIEDLCNRLIIIDHGKIIYDGTLSAVKDKFARERTIHFQMQKPFAEPPSWLNQLPGVELHGIADREIALRFDRFRVTASEVVTLAMKYGEIIDFRMDEPDIEHVIKRVYEGSLELDDVKLAGESS
ncbi:ATP-binding cassette domain-containing protein [Cohnella suwonensis]|uniref:ATP-binding cassette domain-containing protein n=1 Tax=Cohnella suwonensis TaxID=696072 RepID=A0ABW0LS17_9BACL